MAEKDNKKIYDLEERTLVFARNVRTFIKEIPTNLANIEDGKQLVRSSGSIGANYIEANESLGKKDFLMRIKICRKESKESTYWLKLIDTNNKNNLDRKRQELIDESKELMNIFGAILRKST
jgi:four helix bundle protein